MNRDPELETSFCTTIMKTIPQSLPVNRETVPSPHPYPLQSQGRGGRKRLVGQRVEKMLVAYQMPLLPRFMS